MSVLLLTDKEQAIPVAVQRNGLRAVLAGPGKRSLRAVLERLHVAHVHAAELNAADPGLESFVDLDTPEDLAKADTRRKANP